MTSAMRFWLGFAIGQLALFGFAAAVWAQRVHVVEPGDTLSAIARRFGADLAALVRDNALVSADRIYVGQRLRLPGYGTGGGPGGASAAALATDETMAYTVQPGESLSQIAARHGTTVEVLVRHNNLASPDLIWAGVPLEIPLPAVSAGIGGAAADGVPAPPAPAAKRVHIDLSEQRLYAYEGDALAQAFAIATGSGQTPSPTGSFHIYRRLPRQDMSGPGYFAPDVPWVQYFSGSYAVHGTYWHNSFGTGVSHGCINMRTPDAQWLYFWTEIGTPLSIGG